MANALHRDAVRTLGIGAASAVLLVLISWLLVRWLLRRQALERQLERDRRLTSLGEMSAVMAHEMRNPLTSLKGHAQLLAEDLDPGSGELAKAKRVIGDAQRLEDLTTDLLEFVRTGTIEPTLCDPAALLRDAAASCDSGGDSDRLQINTGRAPSQWTLDRARMHEVLTNLLGNGLEAAPPPSRVDATVACQGQHLVYTVRDHGQGVAAADRERIFEPFYTTRTRGTGLGLAVARRFVELHGGVIAVSNHPEGGAQFEVTIPADQPERGTHGANSGS